jgi:hypothetical protein
MQETKHTKISILKTALIILPITLVLLIIWVAFVYIGNRHLNIKVDARQYLLWLINGIIIFILYPIFSKIFLSRWISQKKLWKAVIDIPKLKKTDWLFFIILHLLGIFFLFWVFSNIQMHIDIYNYFVTHFGKGTRGQPRFPIMIFLMATPLIFLSIIYLLVIKFMYGTFNEPKFENNQKDNNFRQKRKVYFSFVLATSVIIMFSYSLKMILMI